MSLCGFNQPWVGKCKEERIYDEQGVEMPGCKEHFDKKCQCGKPAVTMCDMSMGGLMCGAPTCGNIVCDLKHRFISHYIEFGWAIDLRKQEDRDVVVKHCLETLQLAQEREGVTEEQVVEILSEARRVKHEHSLLYDNHRDKCKPENLEDWDQKSAQAKEVYQLQMLVIDQLDKELGINTKQESA